MTVTAERSDGHVAGLSIDASAPLLTVENLQVEFRIDAGVVHAVNGLSYHLDQGEMLAILGESGSGKSVSAQAVMGIIDTRPGFVTGGSVRFRGAELLALPERQRRLIRGQHIAMVFQDALSALNPCSPSAGKSVRCFASTGGCPGRRPPSGRSS